MLIVLAGVGLCRAATYYVAPGGDDTRTGLDDWTNALATISNGVFWANQNAGDAVLVSNGTYVLSTNIYITNGITLRGFNGRDEDKPKILGGNMQRIMNRVIS